MNLYLIQHAEAKDKDDDPDRPLTDQGRKDIRQVAGFVAEHNPLHIHQIFHSGKTRARQTAEILAEVVQPPGGVSEASDLQATDDPAIWADQLSKAEEDTVLVGHKPYMPKLASLLVTQDQDQTVVDFRKGGIVCLGRDSKDHWSVQWAITPQLA